MPELAEDSGVGEGLLGVPRRANGMTRGLELAGGGETGRVASPGPAGPPQNGIGATVPDGAS